MGLYIFIQLLLQIQLYRNNTKKSHFFIEMKISYTLFLTVMVAITIERCRAEYLLVAVDDDVVREPNNDDEIRRQEIEELRQNDICEIKPCCCDSCYPCDYELLAELRKIAEERKASQQQKAVEPKIVPTPRECCKKAGVPAFCLGNCSPADAMARQGKRINACSKYDTIIERCFQAAEPMRLPEPELKPIQEQNAPASKVDPGQCIGYVVGFVLHVRVNQFPKKIQDNALVYVVGFVLHVRVNHFPKKIQNPKNNQEANVVHVHQVPFVASMTMNVDHHVLSNCRRID